MKYAQTMDTEQSIRLFHPFRLAFVVTLCITSVACSTQSLIDRRTPAWARDLGAQKSTEADVGIGADATQQPTPTPPPKPPDNSFYRPGTGELFGAPTAIAEAAMDGGEIKLNFQNANLLEVVKVVLGDMLGATYVIDPRVQGAVTMQTSRPLTRSALIPTLELLLRMNEAALVMDGDIYRVMPVANAVTGVRAPQLGDSALPLPRGYSVRVVPLKYVAADEMAQILEPFIAGGNNLLRTDSKRNAIILAGSGEDMARLIETIRVFDVDRMRGMSVAMFTPDFVDAKTLGEELDVILADPDYGLMSGLVRIVVIERLNGLMVVTPRPEYLAQVRAWIRRLDLDSGGTGPRLFVYRVQNGQAIDLAETLNQLYQPEQADQTAPPELAPGLTPTTARSTPDNQDAEANQSRAPAQASAAAFIGEGLALSNNAQVRFIADEPNNALLILASAREYRQILATLEQLDLAPMQVLIDVTIAEVTLTDSLEFGVEWFFQNNIKTNRGDIFGQGLLDLGAAGLNSITPGFSYALRNSNGDAKAVLNMLATESNLSILSSPSLLVLNNQEASIQVGEEVPVTTQQQQSTDANANIINSIEYRDTGVQLQVKPRVNSGGLVIMEIEQEDSRVPQQNNPDPLTPRIQNRTIKSTVAVQSGDTIVLGGLIRDNRDLSESGIPGLHKIPIFGALFGSKGDNQVRTELLVLITPRAVLDRNSAIKITEEFRRKLNSLIPIEQGNTSDITAPPAPARMVPPAAPTPRAAPAPANAPLERQSALPASDPEDPGGGAVSVVCDRVGPFAGVVALHEFRRQHANLRFLDLPKTLAETTSSHQVITPAYPTQAQAYATADRLKAAGIKETLVYLDGPSANAVSVGVFSSLQNAQRMVARAAKMGIDTELKPRTKSVERYWTLARHRLDRGPLDLPPRVSATRVACPTQSA